MKSFVLAIAATLAMGQVYANKSCDELKTEIAAKIDAAGGKNYTLEIVEKDKVGEAKVIGSCEGGTKKITYAKK